MKNCLQWRAAPAELSDMVLTMFRESGLEMKNTIGEPDAARTVVFCRAATITKTASVRSVPCAVSFCINAIVKVYMNNKHVEVLNV